MQRQLAVGRLTNAVGLKFIGTFILLLLVFAVTDKKNSPPPGWLVPLVVFFTILGVSVAFGMQTGMLPLPLSGPL